MLIAKKKKVLILGTMGNCPTCKDKRLKIDSNLYRWCYYCGYSEVYVSNKWEKVTESIDPRDQFNQFP